MRIVNRSDWKTKHLKELLKAIKGKTRGIVVEFKTEKHGTVVAQSTWSQGRIVSYLPSRGQYAKNWMTDSRYHVNWYAVIGSIAGKLRGCTFNHYVINNAVVELKPYRKPKRAPKDAAGRKLWYARERLRKAERRHKLATTLLKKWQAKVKRLERKSNDHKYNIQR